VLTIRIAAATTMARRVAGRVPQHLDRLRSYLRRHHIALLALFVALGGTSYAAASLPADSVGDAQLKADAVTSPKVKNGSLLAADFSAAELATMKGPKGDTGDVGATGPKGDTGATGPAGAVRAYASYDAFLGGLDMSETKNFVSVERVAMGVYCLTPGPDIADVDFVFVVADWPAGSTAVGGGHSASCTPDQFLVVTSEPAYRADQVAIVPSNGVGFRVFVP
jgi:hypothetical protein